MPAFAIWDCDADGRTRRGCDDATPCLGGVCKVRINTISLVSCGAHGTLMNERKIVADNPVGQDGVICYTGWRW